jgi:SAC3/GANP family
MPIIPVKPYEMCTLEECQLRVRTNEISLFERYDGAQPQQDFDPCKVISKYRRSAAGSFTNESRPNPRSLEALQKTVQYLMHHILIPSFSTQTFLTKISFWEDRIRAVQADLVRSNAASKNLQYTLIRCHILIQYLLSDCEKYEHSFGFAALQTALSGYWNDPSSSAATNCMDDEVLSYNTLIQFNQQLHIIRSSDDESLSSFWCQFTELYRNVVVPTFDQANFPFLERPLLHWTLQFVFQCTLGYWQSALSMLLHTFSRPSSRYRADARPCERFLVFARCCMASSIPYLRYRVLQTLNVSCMKNESLSMAEVARILCFNSKASSECSELCRSFGLPIAKNGEHVVLKSVPMQAYHIGKTHLTRSNDSTVLGTDVQFDASCDRILIPTPEWMTYTLV